MQSKSTSHRQPCKILLAMAAMFLVAGLSVGANAHAQQPLPQPSLNLVASGTVLAIARQADGGTIIGGLFTSVDGQPRQNIARRKPDGSLDPDWKPSFDNRVTGLAIDPSGAIYVAGSSYLVEGVPRYNVVRLTAAGAVDASWDPPYYGPTSCVAVDADGNVFAGGSFEDFTTGNRYSLVKFNPIDGGMDSSWIPSSPLSTPISMLIDGNWLYVGGARSTTPGDTSRSLTRFSRSGPGTPDPAWTPVVNGSVAAMAKGQGDDLFVAGRFDAVGSSNLPRAGVAKLSITGSGAFDSAWNPTIDPAGIPLAIAVDSAGASYVGVNRHQVVGMPAPTFPSLVKLAQDGTGVVDPSFNPGLDGPINALSVASPTSLDAGGMFVTDDATPFLSLATINALGVPAAAVDIESKAVVVAAIAFQPDGATLVGGSFVKADNMTRRNLLRLLPDGSLDASWNPATNGDVVALAVASDGSVYASGRFTQVNGQARNGMVKIAAGPAGVVAPNWTSPIQSGLAKSIAVYGIDAVFIGGDFQTTNAGIRYLARLAPDTGALDDLWNPVPNGEVSSLLLDGDHGLLAGGLFTTIASTSQIALAKLDVAGTGTIDPIWNAQLTNFSGVVALALDDNFVYAAGSIRAAGIWPQQHARFAINGTGGVDVGWNPSSANVGRILGIATGSDASLYTIERKYSGGFNPPFDYLESRKIRTDDAGSRLAYWQPTFLGSGPVAKVAVRGETVFFGGAFIKIGNQPRVGIAALSHRAPDVIYADGFD